MGLVGGGSFVSAEHTGWPSEGPARDYGVALIPDYRDLGRGRSRTSVSSALTPRSFYDRAMPGRVVLLHGASSSGKMTIARAVQRLSDEPWVRLGIDAFWNAIDERWMEHGPRASEGFLWREDATIVPGPVGQGLAAGMRAALAAFAPANNDLLVDDVFIDPAWLDGWRTELAGVELLLVGVGSAAARLGGTRGIAWQPDRRGGTISGRRYSPRHRVRPHRGHITSVAGRVRPFDPRGADALPRTQGTFLNPRTRNVVSAPLDRGWLIADRLCCD